MTLTVNGVPRFSGGTVTVLTSNDPLDENTFEEPTRVVPKTTSLTVSGRSIMQKFAPYSLTVIRLSGR
jgi:alpha-N-arabinofuranosidase